MSIDEMTNPFKKWKAIHCDPAEGGKFLLKGDKSIGALSNRQLFEMYCTSTVEKKTMLTYEDALHIGRQIFAWSVPALDENCVYQVRGVFCTVTFYRQTNLSGDRWKKAFDYLEDRGYKLPFETMTDEQLRALKEIQN